MSGINVGPMAPTLERVEFVVSWPMVTAELERMATTLRRAHGLRGEVTGIYPLAGAEVPAAAISAAMARPVTEHVGPGVAIVGLVARGCAEAQHYVDAVGEGLPAVLWAFRAPEAPRALTGSTLPGLDPPMFPVAGYEVAADWLVMPWDVDRAAPVEAA